MTGCVPIGFVDGRGSGRPSEPEHTRYFPEIVAVGDATCQPSFSFIAGYSVK